MANGTQGSPADKTLAGGLGIDTVYQFARGDGQDTIMAGVPDVSGQAAGRLNFGAGITLADVDVSMRDAGLLLRLKGSDDSVWIADYFNAPEPDRLLIAFDGDVVLDAMAINRTLYPSNDWLTGTAMGDVLDGGLSDDTLLGQEGNDQLYGDAGNDWMDGGAGTDTCYFGRGDGRDTLIASGPDSVGDEVVLSADIRQTDVSLQIDGMDLLLNVLNSTDSLRLVGYFSQLTSDSPVLRYGNGVIWDGAIVARKAFGGDVGLNGGPGGDLLEGGSGNDTIYGDQGDDTLYGDGGRDILIGGAGADTYLFGRGDGQDMVFLEMGSSGDAPDRLQLGSGITMADVLFRLDGNDLLLNFKTGSDGLRIANYMSAAEPDRLLVQFADGASLDGQAISQALQMGNVSAGGWPTGPTTVIGGLNDDFLTGTDGNDTLYGGRGRDVMDGGQGIDTYLFGRGDGQDMVIDSAPGAGSEPDRLRFATGINMADVDVSAEYGMLKLRLKGGDDMVTIGAYFNVPDSARMLIQFADGSQWDAQAINRKLHGGPDLLYGDFFGNVLDGGAGDDVIVGMEGDDVLYGDAGNDRLFGGLGQDTYLFGRGDGQDVIQGAVDELQGDQLVFAGQINVTDVDVRSDGSDLILSIQDSTDSVRVQGYFNNGKEGGPIIRFASGAAWDAGIIQRKLSTWQQTI